MNEESRGELENFALKIRKHCVVMTHQAKASHIGSSLSMVELLTVLYNRILHVDPRDPHREDRDRFILSKGHACAALYAVLAERGFFPITWLNDFYVNGSHMTGHATHTHIPGIEVSTGSLGHGLSLATGMALAAKRDGKAHRVFCLLSDGECDEGSTWEPVLFASQNKLDNLIAIVDFNKIQSLGTVEEVINLEPFADKWSDFGWGVVEIDGHDLEAVDTTLSKVPVRRGSPTCIIAHTVKGKGISFMENKLLWHYRSPQGEEYSAALAEIESKMK